MSRVKISILGEAGSGKSVMTKRLITGNYMEECDPTIGDSYRKTFEFKGIPNGSNQIFSENAMYSQLLYMTPTFKAIEKSMRSNLYEPIDDV